MNYCKTCHINYNTPLNKCLFCNNELTNTIEEELHYNYPVYKKEKKRSHAMIKLFSFLLLIANITCIFIDFNTKPSHNLNWSLYVLTSSIYAMFLLMNFTAIRNIIKKIITFFILTILLLIAIGLIHGNYHWAVDYILPFGIMTSTFFMTISLLGRYNKVYDFSIYVMISAGFSIIPFLCYLTNITRTDWPSLACVLYSAVTLFALFMFRPKDTINELKRRLYF